jgi:hypothetical protein
MAEAREIEAEFQMVQRVDMEIIGSYTGDALRESV